MTNPIVRAFRPGDAMTIINRDGQQGDATLIATQAESGPAFTAEFNGEPIGCGGIILQWPGFGVCWMVLSKEIEPHAIWLCKTTRDFLRRECAARQLHRLEAWALVESARNREWLEWLGFTQEKNGMAQHYLPDRRSVVRYERVGTD